jgi:hypothetical protein
LLLRTDEAPFNLLVDGPPHAVQTAPTGVVAAGSSK